MDRRSFKEEEEEEKEDEEVEDEGDEEERDDVLKIENEDKQSDDSTNGENLLKSSCVDILLKKSLECEITKMNFPGKENLDIEANETENRNEETFFNYLNESIKRRKFKKFLRICLALTLLSLYVIFLVFSLRTTSMLDKNNYWCDGDGFLIFMTTFFGSLLLYFQVAKPLLSGFFLKIFGAPFFLIRLYTNRIVKIIFYIILSASFLGFLINDTEDFSRFISAFGAFVLILVAITFSKNRRKIRFDQIFWGLALQITFALLILRWSFGKQIFQCLGVKVSNFLSFTDAGTRFAIGEFLDGTYSFALKILPVILFLGMFTSIFYHFGILQWVIIKLGWILQVVVGTTPCESMAAIANIFLGMSEAPLVIKPYIHLLTKSEIHAIMTGGFATMAGSVLAALTYFGVDAAHLLSASLISAPAALTMSKLFYPETETSQTQHENIKVRRERGRNVLEAIMVDLKGNIKLIAIITANLIIFVGAAALLNSLTDWSCQLLAYEEGYCQLQKFLGYLFYPLAWLMGVPKEDCHFVGYLLGMKVVVTEILAYKELGEKIKQGAVSARAAAIATYALCGFSSLPAMTAAAGALSTIAPSRIKDFSQIVLRAFIAGNFASFLTACVAGILINDPASRISMFDLRLTNSSSLEVI